jgi:hypothetical protein
MKEGIKWKRGILKLNVLNTKYFLRSSEDKQLLVWFDNESPIKRLYFRITEPYNMTLKCILIQTVLYVFNDVVFINTYLEIFRKCSDYSMAAVESTDVKSTATNVSA